MRAIAIDGDDEADAAGFSFILGVVQAICGRQRPRLVGHQDRITYFRAGLWVGAGTLRGDCQLDSAGQGADCTRVRSYRPDTAADGAPPAVSAGRRRLDWKWKKGRGPVGRVRAAGGPRGAWWGVAVPEGVAGRTDGRVVGGVVAVLGTRELPSPARGCILLSPPCVSPTVTFHPARRGAAQLSRGAVLGCSMSFRTERNERD